MASPEAGVRNLRDLAGRPIGVGSNTILEYVMDKLMEAAGVPDSEIVSEEIQKIPVRYEMMTSNQVAAAALPNSLLVLGEAAGMVLVADDAHDARGQNLSQSVMVTRDEFATSADGAAALPLIREAWDEAAAAINANPAGYRALLAEKTLAAMPQEVQDSYPVPTYPIAERPTAEMIDPVLAWMLQKGYLTQNLSYDATTGAFVNEG
jgi:NitT/TauT family transport system substrate-binding protein